MVSGRVFAAVLGATLTIGDAADAQVAPDAPKIVFQSGFEGTTRIDGNRIVGRDPRLADSDWEADLARLAAPERVVLNYTGGDASQRFADIVADPAKPSNRVLRYWLGDAWLADGGQRKARVQLDLYSIKDGARVFGQSVRMYLHPDFRALEDYPKRITWLTIGEFWNNEWWIPGERHGFRITVGIGKPIAGPGKLTFLAEAQDAGHDPATYAPRTLWHRAGEVEVPIGTWFTIEYDVVEGDRNRGRFVMSITPDGGEKRVIYDIADATHNTSDPAPNGVTGFNPMKLYTSSELVGFMKDRGKPLQIYWDDLRIWKAK